MSEERKNFKLSKMTSPTPGKSVKNTFAVNSSNQPSLPEMQSDDTESTVSNEGGTALGAAAAPECGISSATHQESVAGHPVATSSGKYKDNQFRHSETSSTALVAAAAPEGAVSRSTVSNYQQAVAGPSRYLNTHSQYSFSVYRHYKYQLNEIIESPTAKYEVLKFLGRGAFAKVVKSRRVNDGKVVAMKMSTNHPVMVRHALREAEILKLLKGHEDNFLYFFESFKIKNHVFLVLEMLQSDLRNFLRNEGLKYLPLKMIHAIVEQILRALHKLKELGVIHTDIKPDNIMMVNPRKNAYPKIKLIDFGSACHKSETIDKGYLQTIYYRSPEIILGLPFCEAIDMWSLGCVAAELFLGWPLYPGRTEFDQIRYICQTQGVPPSNMLNRGTKTKKFFRINLHHARHSWRLKARLEYDIETGIKSIENNKKAFPCLDGMEYVHEPTHLGEAEFKAEKEDRRAFIKLIKRMLAVDQEQRVTPEEALNDAFLRLSHFVEFSQCDTAESPQKAMEPSGSHRQTT